MRVQQTIICWMRTNAVGWNNSTKAVAENPKYCSSRVAEDYLGEVDIGFAQVYS